MTGRRSNIVVRNTASGDPPEDLATIEIREASNIPGSMPTPGALLIAVIKQPNANLVDLSKAMEVKITELKSILPGVSIQPYYIQADL